MTMKKNEGFKYLAGISFVLTAVLEVAFYIQVGKLIGYFSMDISMWIDVIGKVLTGIAVLVEMPILVFAGSAVSLISLGMRMISGEVWTYGVFWTIFWSILAISYVSKKYARPICFAAGAVEMVHFVLTVQQANVARLSFVSIYVPLSVLILALGAIFLGVVIPEMVRKPKQKSAAGKKPQASTENKLEQIEKLNDLLKKGYITKEEFDTKKEQLMKAEQ